MADAPPPDLYNDPLIRTAAVAAFALFTLLMLIPLAPCRFEGGKADQVGSRWDMCGESGWHSLAFGYALGPDEPAGFLLGNLDLASSSRWFVYGGLFGLFYMAFWKLYRLFVARIRH